MDDTTKAKLLGRILRWVPLPGRYLGQVIATTGLDLNKVGTPFICGDRWGEVQFCVRDPNDLVERHILLQGYFEYYESQVIRRLLVPGGTFLDIGANVGWHTLLAARKVGAAGRVIALEPVSTTFTRLMENIELNGFRNVEAVQVGLSATNSTADIFMAAEANAGGNSLFPSTTSDARVETVTLRKGDDLLRELHVESVDLCKIDIEGAELDALEGLKSSFEERRIRTLIIEANAEALARSGKVVRDLTAILRGYGFSVRALRNPNGEIVPDEDMIAGANLLCKLE